MAGMKDRIRRLRLARGMTLQQVASHFGISAASVSSWEKGINQPDSRKLATLSDVLGTSVEYLLGGSERMESRLATHDGEGLPFVPWELLGAHDPSHDTGVTVPALHTDPSESAFATRYPGGATGVDWQPGRLPAGALVVVEPSLTPQPGDLALLLDRTGRPYVGAPVSGTTGEPDGPRYRDYSAGTVHGGSRLLGRIVEWRLSGLI
jgi:transcriptional regulator with XRE-family HTH domain